MLPFAVKTYSCQRHTRYAGAEHTALLQVVSLGLNEYLMLQVHFFGDPFLLRVADTDTLADVRPQIQQKLGIADDEFAKWKFAACASLRPPDYLSDDDNVASKFVKSTNTYSSGHDSMCLGLEHTDAHPHRHRHHNNRCVGWFVEQLVVLTFCRCKVLSCNDVAAG